MELLPCPFCGSSVALTTGGKTDGLLSFVCKDGSTCRGSKLLMCCLVEDRETAVTAWNTRALITAARRPALPDREAVELAARIIDPVSFEKVRQGGQLDDAEWRCNRARDKAAHILAPSPAQAEREGWVLVPREPTEAMLQPACAKHTPGAPMRLPHEQWRGTEECPSFAKRRRIWASMLSAAPKVTT